MSLVELLKEAHSRGKEYADKSTIEFLKDIDTDPRVLGLYLYAGTPMPISYAEGFLGYFFKKEYKKN
jgi:hypothetical protein